LQREKQARREQNNILTYGRQEEKRNRDCQSVANGKRSRAKIWSVKTEEIRQEWGWSPRNFSRGSGLPGVAGSFLKLRTVTTRNRVLKTKEVQAAAACYDVASYFGFKHKYRSYSNKFW